MTAPPRLAWLTPYVANLVLRAVPQGWGPAQWRAHAAHLRSTGHRALANEVDGGYEVLLAAAAEWQAVREPVMEELMSPSTSAAFVDESGPAKVARLGAGSLHEDEVTVAEAARMLSVSPQRVGQLLGKDVLSGRRLGRSWLVDRGSVVGLLELRRSA